MSTERTSKKRAQPEDDDCIGFIDREDIIDIEKLTSDDTNDKILNEHAFDKLLNKEKPDLLNLQVKNKGNSKLHSWVYNWNEQINYLTDPKKIIFVCKQSDNGEDCTKIETTGSTGNIISHLSQKHKIYEHTKPLAATQSLKQVKINNYITSSKSTSQITQDQQKYLETLLFEWLILDFQPLYLLKSPSFYQFINALNGNFELLTNKKF